MIAPQIDPVALQLGPIAIHWYGMMYVFAFISVWFLTRKQLREKGLWQTTISAEVYENLFTWLILGVILGGRIGYVLFYNLPHFLAHPIEIFYVWQGGMSFHGGLIGPIIAGWFYCKKHQLPFFTLADHFFIVAPLGLAFGRLGNFINGELWGRVTDVPWAMIFPHVDGFARHPSQLYELSLEGLVLFALLWFTRRFVMPAGSRVALFLIGYGIMRIFCENFREPDVQLGYFFGFITMGMILSSAMVITGVAALAWLFQRKEKPKG
ncbi:MAG: prolipoprotein diacylglyceryl transferase [Zetaproteobacteria bacterium]|nr:prolipoprotein diacylglyceryl transferase [Zetaproteobacteria bacterium]